MSIILVTGAAGRIGTMLRPRLARPGRTLRLLDTVGLTAGPGEEAITASITDPGAMTEACQGADAVIHLAGIPGEAPWPQILEVNIDGTHAVFEAARRAGVGRVVYASSNHAVGFTPRSAFPVPDYAFPAPDTYYGVSKVAGEALAALYHYRYGLDAICLRILTCAERPMTVRSLSTWLSPDDAGRLFDSCLTAPSPGFRVAFGVSANTRGGWVSLDEARALGYQPRDDAEAYAAEVIAAEGEPDPADPLLAYLGGELTLPGPAAEHRAYAGSMSELLDRHRQVMPNWVALYYDEPLEIVSGAGSRVTDSGGRSYLDFFCGILTNMLGYDVPEVREAVERQLGTGVVHTSTLYLIRNQVELAEKIARLSGIADAKVFFTNSGTEANETALLLATAARRSNQVLALRNSYHGRSFGAVAITGNGAWRSSQLAPFAVHYLHGTDRQLPAFAGMSDAEYIAAAVADLRHVLATATAGDVACLIAEPIQGVGGFTMPPDGLLGAYHEVLAERGILLISDEVQTGWGRTGEHFWGIGAHGVVPDMITFAKGLGNGFAIGGVVARGELMDGPVGNGISTFGGNPVATAAANATLDYVLSHDLQRNAAVLGDLIIGGLRDATEPLAAVGGVRGKGLMFAVDLVDPVTGAPSPALAARALEEARKRGLLIGKGGLFGHTLRMAPPLTLTEAEAKEGLGILTDALRAVDAEASR